MHKICLDWEHCHSQTLSVSGKYISSPLLLRDLITRKWDVVFQSPSKTQESQLMDRLLISHKTD